MCYTEEVVVPVGYGNLHPLRMLVHTPKALKGKPGANLHVPYFSLH